MPDNVYCYPNSDVLINKLNITKQQDLFEAEKELTYIRLKELQENPIRGSYDFNHLKAIHKYIFQDLYDWAGKERTVEIGKGNLFCTTACLKDYAKSVFAKYFSQCYSARNNIDDYITFFAKNYGDLNALHPFREGNGRAQREFVRLVCMECGYDFNLSSTTHQKMLEASKLSFNKGDNSAFIKIFSTALRPLKNVNEKDSKAISILTSNDLSSTFIEYGYDEYEKQHIDVETYNRYYHTKIDNINKDTSLSVHSTERKIKNNFTKANSSRDQNQHEIEL